MNVTRKRLIIAMFAALLLVGAACSSDDETTNDASEFDDAVQSGDSSGDDDSSDDDGSSLGEDATIAKVSVGDTSFEVEAICATINGSVVLTTDSVDEDVAVEQSTGTIIVKTGAEDPSTETLWAVVGGDVTVDDGQLVATGTAANPLAAGEVLEPAEVKVTADCPNL